MGMTVEYDLVELESPGGEHILGMLDATHSFPTENFEPHTYGGSFFTKLLHSYMS